MAYRALVRAWRHRSQPSSFLNEALKCKSSASKGQRKQETGVKKPEQALFLPFRGKARFPCAENFFDLLEILWRPFRDKNKSCQNLVLWHNFRKPVQTEIVNESPFLQIKSSRPE